MQVREEGEVPSEQNPKAFRIVQQAVSNHLSGEYAWPRTIFEFELRGAGIYPDFTGRSLEELYQRGELGELIESNGRKYFTRPGEDGQPSAVVENAVDKYYELLDHVGNFGELVAFAAICHIADESDGPIQYVLPEQDQTHRLQGIRYKPDIFLEYGTKCTPIEVYNGAEYITEGHRKIRNQVLKASSDESPHSRPILIAPLASDAAEEEVLNGNGVIAQTGKPVVCKNQLDNYERYLRYLNIKNNFKFLSPITTRQGLEVDGEMYSNFLGGTEYRKITPDKILAERIPNPYIEQIRGGIQWTYVASLYQEANSKLNKYACLVLQPLFHHLLRNDSVPFDDLLQFGWEDLAERYKLIKANVAKNAVLEQTTDYIQHLIDLKIIEQNEDRYSTYKSKHPHLSLSLDKGLPM